MGLDFGTAGIPYEEDLSYNERAHWSYSGFNDFRRKLARAALGLILEDIWRNPDRYRAHLLFPLLYHSDCDGTLSPEECASIAPVLLEAVWKWPERDYDRANAIRLANHMTACAKMGRALIFR